MNNKQEHDYKLDLIRILAMLIIFSFHFAGFHELQVGIFPIYANGGWGAVGTAIFFVLSGYCISLRKRTFSTGKDIFQFYRSRFLTIYPLLWLTFLVFFLINTLIRGQAGYGGSMWRLIFSVLGIDNYLIFFGVQNYALIGEWYTCVIVLIYLLYPILNKGFNRARILTTIILTGLYVLYIVVSPPPVPADSALFTGVLLFWIGMLLCEYREMLTKYRAFLLPISLAVVLLVLYVPLPFYKSSLPWKNLLAVAIFVLLWILGSRCSFRSAGVRRFLAYESKICFAIYLCHHVLINWIPVLAGSRVLTYFVVMLVCQVTAMVLAWCSTKSMGIFRK